MGTTSCQLKEPFVKLQENGSASILNYSLPQNTSYNATAFLKIEIPPEWLFSTKAQRTIIWIILMLVSLLGNGNGTF